VQAAIDFIPEKNPERKIIRIKKGVYDEIVYFRNKENITFLGEDREEVIIQYPNNGVFNIRLAGVRVFLGPGGMLISSISTSSSFEAS